MIESVSVFILIGIDLDTLFNHDNSYFYLWLLFCTLFLFNLILNLKRMDLFKNIIPILIQAAKNMYPFMFVVVMSYIIFAFVGASLFGGMINSSTPEIFKQATGSQLNRRYHHLNWNDMFNSFAFLYTIQVGNQIPILVNLSSCGRNPEVRDYSGLFFIAFIVLNEMILFNLFIGNLIAISLHYFEVEKKAQELKNEQNSLENYFGNSNLTRKLSQN